MNSEENVPVNTKKFRLLTTMLIAVLIFVMGGVGGYWVGSRQQKSSPTAYQASPQPSWLPSAPPFQRLSLTPTIVTRQTNPATSRKTYTNLELGVALDYPSNVYLHREGWEDTEPPKKLWFIDWANMEYEKVKNASDPNNTEIKLKDLYHLGYYYFSIYIDTDPVYQAPYSITKGHITKDNLILLLGEAPTKPSQTIFQGRPAVRNEETFVSGYAATDIGGSVTYFILDQRRVIRLQGSSYNLQKVPIAALDEILSTFKFLD